MELDFDELFKITVLAMKISRCHPSVKRDKKWLMQFIAIYTIFTFDFYLLSCSIIYHDLANNDFSATCRNGCMCVLYCVVTFQYFVMVYYQQTLTDIIEIIRQDYSKYKHLPEDERSIMAEYANKGLWVVKQWIGLCLFGCFIFPVKNIFLYTRNYIDGHFELVPFYELTYPNLIEERKNEPVVYVFTYIILLFFDFYGGLMYVAFVPLGPIFMMHACGQLELVKKNVDNLFEESDVEVREKLKNIIIQLQNIYSFVDQIKECFRVMYEVTLKGTTIMLPIACYEIMEGLRRGEVSIDFVTFVVGAALISSTPCFYSDKLMEKAEEVRLAVYSCGWERRHDRCARASLLIVLERALRPVAIRTLFRTLCLDALTDLFQQSYAIFNLMTAMWN